MFTDVTVFHVQFSTKANLFTWNLPIAILCRKARKFNSNNKSLVFSELSFRLKYRRVAVKYSRVQYNSLRYTPALGVTSAIGPKLDNANNARELEIRRSYLVWRPGTTLASSPSEIRSNVIWTRQQKERPPPVNQLLARADRSRRASCPQTESIPILRSLARFQHVADNGKTEWE